MSGGRRQHTHRRPDTRPDPRRIPPPPRRPAAHLTGGPLAGCTIHIDRDTADAGTVRLAGGRYVRVDTDQWSYELDHQGDR